MIHEPRADIFQRIIRVPWALDLYCVHSTQWLRASGQLPARPVQPLTIQNLKTARPDVMAPLAPRLLTGFVINGDAKHLIDHSKNQNLKVELEP